MPSTPPPRPVPPTIGKPAFRALAAAGITRLDQLTRFTKPELLALHGVGPKAVGLLEAALRAAGLALRTS